MLDTHARKYVNPIIELGAKFLLKLNLTPNNVTILALLIGVSTSIFLETQNLIITSYFDNAFNKISNLEEIENYRKKLYHFKNYIGTTEGYTFFNDYYIQKMDELEVKYNAIENGTFELNLIPVANTKESKIILFFKKIKKLILQDKVKENN